MNPKRDSDEHVSGTDRGHIGKRQAPDETKSSQLSSSHPDADPGPKPLVTEDDWQEYRRKDRRRAIVSINGEDVDEKRGEGRRAA